MEERKLIAKKPQLLESPDDIDVPLLQYAKKDIEKHKRKMEKMEEKAKKVCQTPPNFIRQSCLLMNPL
jgi:hypothetical protein